MNVRKRRPLLAVMFVLAALGLPLTGQASAFITGIGDQNASMFQSSLYTQLHTKIVRYIAPYDVAVSIADLNKFRFWYSKATASGQRVLVAFYHSERSALRNPSPATYTTDVTKFVRMFPAVKDYQ